MQIGDPVRYTGPSLFEGGKGWTGTVVRLPLAPQMQKRVDDSRVLVDVGGRRPRPVRPEHLAVIAP
jgi:hypothetical protein